MTPAFGSPGVIGLLCPPLLLFHSAARRPASLFNTTLPSLSLCASGSPQAPTLVYEPKFPRTRRRRWGYILRKSLEAIACCALQCECSACHAEGAPAARCTGS
jgi:hypothetical protein